jgi:hypothetical protein
MESGATLELVFACGLVVVPVRPCCQSYVPHLVCPALGSSSHVHLLAAENQALLCWGNALLLLNTLLDARDLWVALCQPKCPGVLGSYVLSWVAEEGLSLRDIVVLCSQAQCRARSPCQSGCALYKAVVSCWLRCGIPGVAVLT